MRNTDLTELELYDLIRDAYPDDFPNDNQATWDAIEEFTANMHGSHDLRSLLGRVIMLTLPTENTHRLGSIKVGNDNVLPVMRTAVSRPAEGSY